MIADLNPFVRGWAGYFGFSQWRELPSLDGWIRRRLRCVAWVQWKTRGQRYRELRRLKVSERSASAAIFSPKGPWRLSFSEALHRAFTKARFRRLGLLPWKSWRALNPPNRRGTDPYARWCGRGGIARCPPIPIDRREHAAPIASGRNHIIPLDQQQSIFETAAPRLPQDEKFQ